MCVAVRGASAYARTYACAAIAERSTARKVGTLEGRPAKDALRFDEVSFAKAGTSGAFSRKRAEQTKTSVDRRGASCFEPLNEARRTRLGARPRLIALGIAVVLAALVSLAWFKYMPRRCPAGQAGLAAVGPNLEALRRAFDGASHDTRIVALLSPTCPVCVRGAADLQSVLEETPSKHLRVFIVWEAVRVTDIGPPTNAVLALLHDVRVTQFWDPDRRVSAQLLAQADDRARAGLTDRIVGRKVAWDLVAVYPPGEPSGTVWPYPRWNGGPVVDVIPDLRTHLLDANLPPAAPSHEHGALPPVDSWVAIQLNGRSVRVPVAALDAGALPLASMWRAAWPNEDPRPYSFDLVGSDGFRPMSRPKCTRLLTGAEFLRGRMDAQTHDVTYDDELGLPGCYRVRHLVAIEASQ
jgi:hypothetical protein